MISDKSILEELENNDLVVCKDNIIRRKKDNHPACPNSIIQELALMRQNNTQMTYFQDKIYGCCIMALREIVINNRHFKYQPYDIKEECKLEMLDGIAAAEKNFDVSRGSNFYSYLYRIFYTNAIHVLERHNAEKEFYEKCKEVVEEFIALENSARKVVTYY